MDAVMGWCFWSSFGVLLATKIADIVSTWRHVGVRGESNPIAAALFRSVGLAWGIVLVSVLYVGIAVGQYLCVWRMGWGPLLWANTALGFAIAWVQWDVARCNMTGRHSRTTRTAMSASVRLARWLDRWRSR